MERSVDQNMLDSLGVRRAIVELRCSTQLDILPLLGHMLTYVRRQALRLDLRHRTVCFAASQCNILEICAKT